MRFLLFGTGEYYNRYKIWFDKKDIAALVDNSKEKQGTFIDGIFVTEPQNVHAYEYDVIVILSFYFRSMKSQLIDLGVEECRIYHFYGLHDLIYSPAIKRKIYYYNIPSQSGIQDKEQKRILLLNQDLTLGGPALALYHAAKILIKNGFHVVYGSMIDGPLREILTGEGIPVVVDENLLLETMEESDWINGYQMVLCNTINFHVFLSKRRMEIPVVWWLHDAMFFYEGVNQKAIKRIENRNIKIWAVGPISKKAIQAFRPDFCVENLLYGIEEPGNQNKSLGFIDKKREHSGTGMQEKASIQEEIRFRKMRFAVIGYIEERKGQDILLQAIQELSPDIRKKAEFYFVGQNTSEMARRVIKAAKEIPEIIITGPVGREAIENILNSIDLLICPSREDPMPTVAAEAMMHAVPCLISDAAGTAEYVRNEINGLVFRNQNIGQLKKLLAQSISGKYDLAEMGKNARKVYEEYFSMKAFERRFMDLFSEAACLCSGEQERNEQ